VLEALKDILTARGWDTWARPLLKRLMGRSEDPYDRQTFEIIEQNLRDDCLCIDIGCHRGLILDAMIRRCPAGTFYGFEPIPRLSALLRKKYASNSRVTISDLALSSKDGDAAFFVDSVPGWSGFQRRTSDGRPRSGHEIRVKTARLDDVLPNARPDIIKIDVEGAELQVMLGARQMITQARPLIVFEHSIGGAPLFGDKPEDVFDFLESCGLRISLLADFLAGRPSLSRAEFCRQHYEDLTWNFLAHV